MVPAGACCPSSTPYCNFVFHGDIYAYFYECSSVANWWAFDIHLLEQSLHNMRLVPDVFVACVVTLIASF